jgi:hypothetical protein
MKEHFENQGKWLTNSRKWQKNSKKKCRKIANKIAKTQCFFNKFQFPCGSWNSGIFLPCVWHFFAIFHCLPSCFDDFTVFLWFFNGVLWFSSIFGWFSSLFHWFSLISSLFQLFSLIFSMFSIIFFTVSLGVFTFQWICWFHARKWKKILKIKENDKHIAEKWQKNCKKMTK